MYTVAVSLTTYLRFFGKHLDYNNEGADHKQGNMMKLKVVIMIIIKIKLIITISINIMLIITMIIRIM